MGLILFGGVFGCLSLELSPHQANHQVTQYLEEQLLCAQELMLCFGLQEMLLMFPIKVTTIKVAKASQGQFNSYVTLEEGH